MQTDAAISVNNVSKAYKLYERPLDRLKEAIGLFGNSFHRDFYSLSEVSIEIPKGKTIGIIGQNGSGKSTLLKLIAGVLTPTVGSVEVKGRLAALLELGAGFNPEFTGIENIYFSGAIMGYSRNEMDSKKAEILAFADIGEFVDQPVKTYSSGMFVRLAFAVAISVDPDILVIDEALSVGDMRFQKKCMEKINSFRSSGKTIVFCSHDMHAINELCDDVYWVKTGRIEKSGDPGTVIASYVASMTEMNGSPVTSGGNVSNNPNYYVRNSEIVDILRVETTSETGEMKAVFFDRENISISVDFLAKEALEQPHFNLAVFRKDKTLVYLSSTSFDKGLRRESYAVGQHTIHLKIPNVQLNRGEYIVGISIWDSAKKIVFANNITREFRIHTLKVAFGPTSERAVLLPDVEWGL